MGVRPFAAMDALTLLLVGLGTLLLATAIVGGIVLIQPSLAPPPTAADVPADRIPTLLGIDSTVSTATVLRVGDHVDVLGYFVVQAGDQDNVTRVLLADVQILSITQDNGRAALTLALAPESAQVLHEAELLGVKPLVVVRPLEPDALNYPAALTDAALMAALSEPRGDQVAVHAP